MEKIIRVATRGSQLALTQTRQLINKLQEKNPNVTFKLTTLKTMGDRVTDRPLSSFRGIGVFVKELQAALLDDRADIAIHSLKDVPTVSHEQLLLAGFPKRVCPMDLLLTRNNETFEQLPKDSNIGTSSPRRMVQLKAKRPDLKFSDLRGNLDTRIKKLQDGQYDAIIAAAAGMQRLGKEFDSQALLPIDLCIPAVGQGVLAIECRKDNAFCISIAQSITHDHTKIEAQAERKFLSTLGGGCSMPIAAYAYVNENQLFIDAMVGDPETIEIVKVNHRVKIEDASSAGEELALRALTLCKKKGIVIQ